MENNYSENIEILCKKLVSIKSVNNLLDGETKIAKYIKDYFLKLAYFKKHSDQVITFDCDNNRHSTIAYLKGKGKKTIILMGHIDTVDIKDYGKLEKYATKPDILKEKLADEFKLDKEVLTDLKSNNYLFGRGTLDMKAGVAAFMEIMKYYATHVEELYGNLLFLAECDEEGDSKGIIKALDILKDIKEKEGFKYVACINGDYSKVEDNNRYLYLGTVGKLLPCFVAMGKESHVGSPFKAIDPNLLLSLINKNMSLNMELTDKSFNETTVPPISLKQKDNKDSYTVQTANSAFSYFNYMLYTSSPKEVMNKCIKIAKESIKEAYELINKNYKEYCLKNNLKYKEIKNEVKIFTYDKWLKELDSHKKDIENYKKKLLKEEPNIDMREYSYRVIQKSYEYYDLKKPVLILFFGSMFYSSNLCKDKKLIDSINAAIKKTKSKYKIKTAPYYPYISDMSLLNNPFSLKEMATFTNNLVYPLYYPYDKIKALNIPVVNIGTYGKDGHTYVERLEKTYSFKEMPKLVDETIKEYLKKSV